MLTARNGNAAIADQDVAQHATADYIWSRFLSDIALAQPTDRKAGRQPGFI
jgi:hypothetical protein